MATRLRLRSSSRKDTPLSPPKAASVSVVIDAPPNQNKRRTRSSSREDTAAQQPLQDLDQALSTVAEEEPGSEQTEGFDSSISVSFEASSTGSSFESLLDALDRDAIVDNLINLRNDAIALFSIFEGTDEARLGKTCARLLRLDPLLRRRFKSQERRFLATREVYGGGSDFIIPGLIVRKILADAEPTEINHGPWRPDGVLYLANLALQLVKVLSPSAEEHHSYVDFMFNNFPEPFHDLASFPFSPAMVKDAFRMHTEILTQFYIRQVEIKHHNEGFDPDKLLGAVFCDESNKIKGSSDETTHSEAMTRMSSIKSHFNTEKHPWIDIKALQRQYPWSDFAVQVVKWSVARKDELDKMIKSRGGIDKLVNSLIVGDFQDAAALADRVAEVPGRAGPDTKVQGPAAIDIEAEDLENTNSKSTHPAQRAVTGTLLRKAMKANVNRLKALKVEQSARTPGAKIRHVERSPPEPGHESSHSLSPVVEETQEAAVDEDDGQVQRLAQAGAPDEEIVPTQQTNIVLETVRRQNERSNKENKKGKAKKASLLDRQQGAEMVEWSEPSDDADTPLPPRQLPKRARPQMAEDNDGYDEFETDKRPRKRRHLSGESSRQPLAAILPRLPAVGETATAIESEFARPSDKSQAVASASRGQLSRRARVAPSRSPEPGRRTLPVSPSDSAQSSTQGSPSSRAALQPVPAAKRGLPSSSAPTRTRPESFGSSRPPPQEPPRSQVDHVNQEAKARVRMSRDLLPTRAGVQVRRSYTQQEVNRLMELIELHGTKWVRILEEDSAHEDGPLLQRRTQVQLKDKARNIKLDFLKAGRRLPPGFESVSVGQRKIGELRQLGIDYVEGQNGARYTGRAPSTGGTAATAAGDDDGDGGDIEDDAAADDDDDNLDD